MSELVQVAVTGSAEVALQFVGDQPIGFVLVQRGADVEILSVVQEPNLRTMLRRGRLSFARLLLHEPVGRWRLLPFRFVQSAVDGYPPAGD